MYPRNATFCTAVTPSRVGSSSTSTSFHVPYHTNRYEYIRYTYKYSHMGKNAVSRLACLDKFDNAYRSQDPTRRTWSTYIAFSIAPSSSTFSSTQPSNEMKTSRRSAMSCADDKCTYFINVRTPATNFQLAKIPYFKLFLLVLFFDRSLTMPQWNKMRRKLKSCENRQLALNYE